MPRLATSHTSSSKRGTGFVVRNSECQCCSATSWLCHFPEPLSSSEEEGIMIGLLLHARKTSMTAHHHVYGRTSLHRHALCRPPVTGEEQSTFLPDAGCYTAPHLPCLHKVIIPLPQHRPPPCPTTGGGKVSSTRLQPESQTVPSSVF